MTKQFALPLWLVLGGAVCCGGGSSSATAQEARGANVVVSANTMTWGMPRHQAGGWTAIGVQATNFGDQAGYGTLAIQVGEQQEQILRRIWVPALSTRRSWLPLRVDANPADPKGVDLRVLRIDDSSGKEQFIRGEGQPLFDQLRLRLNTQVSVATIFRRSRTLPNGRNVDEDEELYELAARMREGFQGERVMLHLAADVVPPFTSAYDGLSQLIVTRADVVHDTASVDAIRAWLHRGGRLWFPLDRFPLDAAALLVGREIPVQQVDEVALSEFVMHNHNPGAGPATQRWVSETPARLRRVLVEDAEVQCSIDGWPAAFWLKAGQGEVLFTTLEPRGWSFQDSALADPTDRPDGSGELAATQAVAGRFFGVPITRAKLGNVQPFLTEQIGYTVPGRGLALAVLGGHLATILIVGAVLVRRRRLDHLCWLVPAASLVGSVIMLSVGLAHSRHVPSTVSRLQLVMVDSSGAHAGLHERAAVYSDRGREIPLAAGPGTMAWPEDIQGRAQQRLVWREAARGGWENLRAPARAVQLHEFGGGQPLDQPIEAWGRFESAGLVGRLESSGAVDRWDDPVICAPPAPAIALRVDADGRFASGPDDVLAAGEFSAAGVLSDTQRRRIAALQQLVYTDDSGRFPAAHAVCFWRPPLDTGWAVPADFRPVGDSLYVTPLRLEQTPPGARFTVPSSFLIAENIAGPKGMSNAFNARTGRWVADLLLPTMTALRFTLPRQVLPAKLDRARLTVKVNAPSRRLKIFAIAGDAYRLAAEKADPSGVYDFELADDHGVPLDAAGGVRLAIEVTATEKQLSGAVLAPPTVSEPRREPLSAEEEAAAFRRRQDAVFDNSKWQIDYVRLTVAGVRD